MQARNRRKIECEKCHRPYHSKCWAGREVKNEKGETIGCPICVKKNKSGKKRKLNDMKDVSEMQTELNIKEIMRKVLIENIVSLKSFIADMVVENSEQLQSEIQELKNEISNLKNEIVDLKKVKNNCNCKKVESSNKVKFSEVVKQNQKVILKPKNKDTEIDIEKTLKDRVNVTDLQIGISEVKTNKTGTVVIKCNNEKSQKCLKKNIEEKLKNKVEIIEPSESKYNIKVININRDMFENNDEEIITTIKKQNEVLKNDVSLKIKKRIKFEKNDSWSLILELNSMAHQQLLEREILYLGWQRCKIFDSANVKRCFN